MDLFYFSIRAGCKDTSVRINNIWLFVISVPFLWCFRFLRFWAFWGCLIRLSFHLHLGLLIDLISSAGALYLQWYQCETCILLMIWLSGSVMFTCTDFCDSFCFLFCFVFLFCLLSSLYPSPSLPPSPSSLFWLLPYTLKGNGTASEYNYHRFTQKPITWRNTFWVSLGHVSSPDTCFDSSSLF